MTPRRTALCPCPYSCPRTEVQGQVFCAGCGARRLHDAEPKTLYRYRRDCDDSLPFAADPIDAGWGDWHGASDVGWTRTPVLVPQECAFVRQLRSDPSDGLPVDPQHSATTVAGAPGAGPYRGAIAVLFAAMGRPLNDRGHMVGDALERLRAGSEASVCMELDADKGTLHDFHELGSSPRRATGVVVGEAHGRAGVLRASRLGASDDRL